MANRRGSRWDWLCTQAADLPKRNGDGTRSTDSQQMPSFWHIHQGCWLLCLTGWSLLKHNITEPDSVSDGWRSVQHRDKVRTVSRTIANTHPIALAVHSGKVTAMPTLVAARGSNVTWISCGVETVTLGPKANGPVLLF